MTTTVTTTRTLWRCLLQKKMLLQKKLKLLPHRQMRPSQRRCELHVPDLHCIALATRATAVQVYVRGSVVYVAGHCPSGAEDAFHKKDMPQGPVAQDQVPRP